MLDDIRDAPVWKPTRPWADWQVKATLACTGSSTSSSTGIARTIAGSSTRTRSIRRVSARSTTCGGCRSRRVRCRADGRQPDAASRSGAAARRREDPYVRAQIEALKLAWMKLTRGDAAVTIGATRIRAATGDFHDRPHGVADPVRLRRRRHGPIFPHGRRLQDVFGIEEGRRLNVFPFAPHLAFWQVYAVGRPAAA